MLNEASRISTEAMAESARAVALSYCSDSEPGLRRVKSGNGFGYRNPDGKRLADPRTLDRIRSLVIPPAWTDVWIAPRANCHIQATGRDQRGRKQYRYHDRWTACRDEVKFASLSEFAHGLPKLRRAIDQDLRKRGLVRDKVLATVVWLLDNVMIRVGNSSYARDNNSFGLTTLQDGHADISGATLRLSFVGKSGKEWSRKITDRRIARIVKGAQDIPGQHLFQYLDEGGERRAISSGDVNDYIRTKAEGDYTSKHFRTWGGTVLAAERFAAIELPESQTATKRICNAAIDEVAHILGNTRTVCRNCYIHPLILEQWAGGELAGHMKSIRKSLRRTPKGLSRSEALVLRWIDANLSKETA